MTSRRRLFVPVALLAAGAGLAGCSRTPIYDAETACSIKTSEVVVLLDTDRFTADDQVLEDLPESIPEAGYVEPRTCFAEGGDARIRVRADVVGSTEVERLQAQMRERNSVELNEGLASIGSSRAVWACGAITLALDVSDVDRSEQISVDEQTMRAAITDLAETVGCPTYQGL